MNNCRYLQCNSQMNGGRSVGRCPFVNKWSCTIVNFQATHSLFEFCTIYRIELNRERNRDFGGENFPFVWNSPLSVFNLTLPVDVIIWLYYFYFIILSIRFRNYTLIALNSIHTGLLSSLGCADGIHNCVIILNANTPWWTVWTETQRIGK